MFKTNLEQYLFILDGMKPTSLSKVAQQLAEFYQIAEEQMNKEPVNNVCDKVRKILNYYENIFLFVIFSLG